MPLESYPQRPEAPVNPQPTVQVITPAASPSGALISTITIDKLTTDKACLSVQQKAGDFLVISSLTVHGSVPAFNRLPALKAAFGFTNYTGVDSYSVEGVSLQGGITDGFSSSSSVTFTHNGEGSIVAGTSGGFYRRHLPELGEPWNYSVTMSIYRLA